MIRLILVRHGNTFEEGQTPIQIGARTDLPLTAKGRRQAEQMGAYLVAQKLPVRAVYTGPLKRQTETARLLAHPFALPIESVPALCEIDYGPWEGLTADAIAARWPEESAAWTQKAQWPSSIFAETLENRLQNLERWFDQLRKLQSGQTLVAVTSSGLLRLLKNEKVNTGHFCEIHLEPKGFQVSLWNQKPSSLYLGL